MAIRHIDSAEPFAAFNEYLRKGWQCPLPLFPGKKHKPPTGFTGYGAKIPGPEDFETWLSSSKYGPSGNICLRLHEISVNKIHKQIVGIDVDDYVDHGTGGRIKTGGADLDYLEGELGTLPATVVSSARQAPSGIRLFLAPAGIRFHDKPMPSIEIIQKHHRYVNVSPSWNPDAEEQYLWWKQVERDPSGNWIREPFCIPDVWRDLAHLPEPWVDYLSSNRTLVDVDIKMDSSTVEDLIGWTEQTFNDGYKCEHIRKVLGYWKKQIRENPSSHDKITKAHWALTGDALNGHRGWHQAIAEIDRYWARDVADRDKRDLGGMRAEIFRSQTGNLRKRKAAVEAGEVKVAKRCACPDEAAMVANFAKKVFGGKEAPGGRIIPEAGAVNPASEAVEEGLEGAAASDDEGLGRGPDPRFLFRSPGAGDYEQNDDGNAEHFIDLYTNNGASDILYVPEWESWAHWEPGKKLWVTEDGNAHRAFRQVKYRQLDYAAGLFAARDEILEEFRKDGDLTEKQCLQQPEYKQAAAKAKMWNEWATRSGNILQVERALRTAAKYPGIQRSSADFDSQENLVGVRNGVMVLGDIGVTFRDRFREDYITMAVPHDFVELDEQRKHPEMREGVQLLEDYFDRFIPDEELRNHLQMVLGYGMVGHNPLRIAVFAQSERTGTGKSTLINLIGAAMGNKGNGGYSASITASLFREAQLNAQLADVLSARFVITSELSEDNYLHADVFKRLVSIDEVSAEKKFQNEQIRRRIAFLPIIATNGAPTIRGADEATRFRMYVVPFDHQIGSADNPDAPVQLIRKSGAAMFAWLVEGYRKYAADPGAIRDRNRWPALVKSRKSEFHSHLSDVNEFLNEMIVKKEDASIPCSSVWDMWVEWCYQNNVKNDYSRNKFGRKITSNGIEKKYARFESGQPPEHRYLGIKARTSGSGPRTFKMNIVDNEQEGS